MRPFQDRLDGNLIDLVARAAPRPVARPGNRKRLTVAGVQLEPGMGNHLIGGWYVDEAQLAHIAKVAADLIIPPDKETLVYAAVRGQREAGKGLEKAFRTRVDKGGVHPVADETGKHFAIPRLVLPVYCEIETTVDRGNTSYIEVVLTEG